MLSFTSTALPDLILMKTWPLFTLKQSSLPAHPVIENSCVNFQLAPRLFPKDGRFGPYSKISTGGDIKTAAIIGRFTLHGMHILEEPVK